MNKPKWKIGDYVQRKPSGSGRRFPSRVLGVGAKFSEPDRTVVMVEAVDPSGDFSGIVHVVGEDQLVPWGGISRTVLTEAEREAIEELMETGEEYLVANQGKVEDEDLENVEWSLSVARDLRKRTAPATTPEGE